jgi:CCR4-NOT transcription complex subunit 4
VADKNTDKKQKTQKVKSKALTVEAKKHLASVRVIQRNLVYIIGLPANLCSESVRTIFFTSGSYFLMEHLIVIC